MKGQLSQCKGLQISKRKDMLWLLLLVNFLGFSHTSEKLFIWKGTRWCGYGNDPEHQTTTTTSTKQNTTTLNQHVDNCCKQHDACPHFIPRWKRKYNLLNWRPFTISSCECDRRFLKCLKEDDSTVSKDVKKIFFDILEVACFDIKLKTEKTCVKRTWFMACKKFAMTTKYYAEIGKV